MFELERPKPRKTRAFYENDYKKMAEGGYQTKGWKHYADSPYKEYERRLADVKGIKKD